jgi:hypothetical protein
MERLTTRTPAGFARLQNCNYQTYSAVLELAPEIALAIEKLANYEESAERRANTTKFEDTQMFRIGDYGVQWSSEYDDEGEEYYNYNVVNFGEDGLAANTRYIKIKADPNIIKTICTLEFVQYAIKLRNGAKVGVRSQTPFQVNFT